MYLLTFWVGELHLPTTDYGVSTTGAVTQFVLDDPTQSMVGAQDGVISYIIQGADVSII